MQRHTQKKKKKHVSRTQYQNRIVLISSICSELVHVYASESHLTDCYCVHWRRGKHLRHNYLIPFKVFFLKFRQIALYSHKTLWWKMFCQYCSVCKVLYPSQMHQKVSTDDK